MRATNLQYRCPKEETPAPYFYTVYKIRIKKCILEPERWQEPRVSVKALSSLGANILKGITL